MNNNDTALPLVIWYGERGIINSIVNHVASQQNPSKTAGRLLDAVQWADAGKPVWLSQIANVNLIVEVGLADFGNPDLMIVCRTKGDDRPYCVFVEAKAICYRFSMGNNSGGMSPGFNSTINGQMSLKYRFAKALGNPISGKNEVVEPEPMFAAYKKQLRDSSHKPRHLKKPKILQLFDDLGLMSLSEDRFYFVALTWDDAKHAFFADSDVQKADNFPLLLDEAGNEVYDAVKSRLGWLGYQNLEKALDLHASDEYTQACCGMFSQSEPTQKDYRRLSKTAGMPEYDADFLEDLFGRFREACGQNTKFFHKQYKGSYSLGVAGRTLAKMIPAGDLVFVGVRDDGTGDRSCTRLPVEKSVQGVSFTGIVLKPDIDSIDVDLYMEDVLQVFTEMAAQTSSQKDYESVGRTAGVPEYDAVFLDDLFGRFNEACGQNTKFFHKQYTGSYSLGIAGRTLAKVIPVEDRVFVGVRDDGKGNRSYTNLPEERTVQGVPFRGVVLKPDIDSIDVDLYMEDILRAFAELAAQTSS